ncbi:transcription factor EMB1444 isoform X3 [Magnolia sinica]|uniref:transcription factor EMB1444 isoform X3 n=1 Tax=Magnolia sinica TaxID=86752 RepID=UPI00265A8F83|nr:transcription factor EMB1444 isoform X3 [Magnolia sinica]
MGEGMGDRLQQILRSLCFKTQWKYAVFWKLKHRARMMLTWEDAYYDNHEEPNPSNSTVASILSSETHDSHRMGDPLGLAVAKMSYLVYSLGEGIIGQVAFTGKHRWIFADEPASNYWSSSEYADGLQAQFSAGIKTIAVVAVVPYGVVQLGSLNSVVEDLKLVSHIKHVFGLLHNSLASFSSISVQHTQKNILNMSADFNDCLHKLDLVSNKSRVLQPYSLPSLGNYDNLSQSVLQMRGFHQRNAAQVADERLAVDLPAVRANGSVESLRLRSGNVTSEFQKQEQLKVFNNKKSGEMNTSGGMEIGLGTEGKFGLSSCNVYSENALLNNFGLPVDTCTVDHPCLPSVPDFANRERINLDGIGFLQDEALQVPQSLEMQLGYESEKKSMIPMTESSNDLAKAPLMFSAGCELHEALGSAFKKEEDAGIWSEAGETEVEDLVKAPDEAVSSLFSGSEHLLEAVVANACAGASNITSENSLCKSGWSSLLTTENSLQTPDHIKHGGSSAGGQAQTSSFLAEDGTHQSMGSVGRCAESFVLKSPKETSSMTPSACSGLSERQTEPSKVNRKRARPGESCRPRPRDRQLIQDRVKELREIVPNGSKCSIDALLERTIKHMIFLQSVTSHADKLKRCAESKLCGNGSHLVRTCSQDRGASWALEVGSQFKASPIVVENLNMNGQMLVEMLCEDCSLFLEIAEVIRGLGFTILKGVTESREEKTWACFVVEGRGNDGLQRMDILWSLMQLQQSKTSI